MRSDFSLNNLVILFSPAGQSVLFLLYCISLSTADAGPQRARLPNPPTTTTATLPSYLWSLRMGDTAILP